MQPAGRIGFYPVMLALFLLGYAVCGRAFAYLGVPPVFVGEILLLAALIQMVRASGLSAVFFLPQTHLLCFFMLWSLLQTAPYISEYGLYALRDGVLWGYGFFALSTAALLWSQPAVLPWLIRRYRVFAVCFPFLALAALSMMAAVPKSALDPSWLIQMKPGDALVHLAAILAFVVCGLSRRVGIFWIATFVLALVVAGSGGRGGLLSFLLGAGVLALLYYHRADTWRLAGGMTIAMVLAGLLLPLLPVFTHHEESRARAVSPMQVAANLKSIILPSEEAMLEGTKRMRLMWWEKIIEDSWFGPQALAGRGYGINLGMADGFAPREDITVRHPHNAHLNILARSGMPGLFLWAGFNIVWAAGMFRALLGSRIRGLAEWEGLFATLLVFQLASLTNASFDVYLEGPMGGIWYWVMMGVGMGALPLFRTMPHLLTQMEKA